MSDPVSSENTAKLLQTEDEIINKWLASIGLTRRAVVDFAVTSHENTKFAAEHMFHGKTTPADYLAGEAIRDALAKEQEKLGLRPKIGGGH